MIRILDGVPGSGKSYHAVEDIVSFLKGGKTVVTNLPLKWEAIKHHCAQPVPTWFGLSSRPGVILEDAQLRVLTEAETQDFWRFLPQGTLDAPVEGVFDELQNLFNSRNWAKTQQAHGDVLKFISHHRHYHTNLTLLTQSRGNIDKQFRVMCAEYWEHIDLNGWTLLGIGWPLPQFLRKKFGQDEKQRLKASFVMKDKRIWALYDSHNKVDGITLSSQVSRLKLATAPLTRFQQVTKMIKSWAIILVVVAAVVSWGWSKLHSGGPAFHNPLSASSAPSSGVASVVAKSAPSSQPLPVGTPAHFPHDQILVETLRYAEGNYHIRTDHASYTKGRLCPLGMVTKVEDDLVTIKALDGSSIYICVQGFSSPSSPPAVVPVAASLVVSPTVAPAIPALAHVPTFTETESKRISDSLHQRVANGTAASQTPPQPVAGSGPLPSGGSGVIPGVYRHN